VPVIPAASSVPLGARRRSAEGVLVSDKSPRQSASKKSDKSIKEKRAIKKAKKDPTDGGVFSDRTRTPRTSS
jgi:hypothetical protein